MSNNVNVIKTKALRSAKWMIITSVASMFFSYLTNVLLGNLSPEILGVYSAVNVFISSLTTFVGMGGAIVLSNYFPKMNSAEERTRLLKTYILMSVAMYVVFVLTILLFPEVNVLLSGGLSGAPKYISLFVMAPIFITMTIISYLLTAMLEARISNIMSKLYTCLLPVVLLVCRILDKSIIENHLTLIVFFSIIFANIGAIILGVVFIKREGVMVKAEGIYVPKGFFVFSLTTFMQALFSFLYRNADKMFLISLGNLGQLGYYQSIISILTLVEFIPSLLGNVTIPYFSNILKIGKSDEVVNSYERIEKYMLFFLVSCVLGVISLSDVALGMFGKDYIEYGYLLMILLLGKCIASLGFTNTPMLVSLEKNWIRFFNSMLQIIIQFTITFFTINNLGILGVVLGRVVGVCCAQIYPQIYLLLKSGYKIKISSAYFAGIACVLSVCVLKIMFELNVALSVAVGVTGWILFAVLGGFKKRDFVSMFNMILKR